MSTRFYHIRRHWLYVNRHYRHRDFILLEGTRYPANGKFCFWSGQCQPDFIMREGTGYSLTKITVPIRQISPGFYHIRRHWDARLTDNPVPIRSSVATLTLKTMNPSLFGPGHWIETKPMSINAWFTFHREYYVLWWCWSFEQREVK